jgi:hypothetical protein
MSKPHTPTDTDLLDVVVGVVISAGKQEHDGREFNGVLIELPTPPKWPLAVVFDALPVELRLSDNARAALQNERGHDDCCLSETGDCNWPKCGCDDPQARAALECRP